LLLQQPGQTGLQVLYPPTNSWISVPAIADRYIVNIGDLLDGWTQGAYRSAVHRVINTSKDDRYSVPFFYHGNLACQLRPLDGSKDQTVITVEQHILKKFSQSFAVKV
jgi:isopenicillin N synthase-like dioxygenase